MPRWLRTLASMGIYRHPFEPKIPHGIEIEEFAEVVHWPDEHRWEFEERCGVLEYEGGYSRDEAERRAFVEFRIPVKVPEIMSGR